jgi:coatomer subunit beta
MRCGFCSRSCTPLAKLLTITRLSQFELDMTKATGSVEAAKDDFISKLNRVVQLTGFSDPVYAEAYVNVHQFDIFLDVLIVNQTNETLQNLSVEFATLGDLKLVERPTSHTLGPHSFQSIKATIKVRLLFCFELVLTGRVGRLEN